jgi:hypothetical protein
MSNENYVSKTTEQLPLKLAERAIAVIGTTRRRRLGVTAIRDGGEL